MTSSASDRFKHITQCMHKNGVSTVSKYVNVFFLILKVQLFCHLYTTSFIRKQLVKRMSGKRNNKTRIKRNFFPQLLKITCKVTNSVTLRVVF